MTPSYRTVLADMPTTIRSYIMEMSPDEYTIVLNSRMDRETMLRAYQHELKHINNGDYEKKCSAGLIEIWAHEGS